MDMFKKIRDKLSRLSKMELSLKPKEKISKKPQTEVQPQSVESSQTGPTVVAQTKFYTGPQPQKPRQFLAELPAGYGENKIILQTRDPWWLHAYWEVTEESWDRLREELASTFNSAKKVLRVYDVSNIIFDGKNAHRFFDIELTREANNWYIEAGAPGRSWCVDLGLRMPDGTFVMIVRSNVAHTPLDSPSWITDEEWMVPDDIFNRLYGLGVGFGSSPVRPKKAWAQRLKRELASGAISSSPVKKEAKKGFWLAVNTELIVYGATESNARVTVQGRPINLRSDGTFSLRFVLPDGKQVIPVQAVSKDSSGEKTITPIVTKQTK